LYSSKEIEAYKTMFSSSMKEEWQSYFLHYDVNYYLPQIKHLRKIEIKRSHYHLSEINLAKSLINYFKN
jgi:hypothetical protein